MRLSRYLQGILTGASLMGAFALGLSHQGPGQLPVARPSAATSTGFDNCYSTQSNPQPVECHLGPFEIQGMKGTGMQATFDIRDGYGAVQFWQGLAAAVEGYAPFCTSDYTLVRMTTCLGGDLNVSHDIDPRGGRVTSWPVLTFYYQGQKYQLTVPMLQWLIKAMHDRPRL